MYTSYYQKLTTVNNTKVTDKNNVLTAKKFFLIINHKL